MADLLSRGTRMCKHGAASALAFIFVSAGHAQGLRPADRQELAGLAMMVHSMQLSRDLCTHLYPDQAGVVRDTYAASSVPAYAELLDYERDFTDALPTLERGPESVGMTDTEATELCFVQFQLLLREFDGRYSSKREQMAELIARLDDLPLPAPSAPAQPARPDPAAAGIVAKIVAASERAYETGDWASFSALYAPGTFDCWRDVPDARHFAFLSMLPIPEGATYEIEPFSSYLFGGPYAFTGTQPTHLLRITYEIAVDADRCGLVQRKRWPRHDFFLLRSDDGYALTHECPVGAGNEHAASASRRAFSAAQTAADLALLSHEEWQRIPEEVNGDPYSWRAENRLAREHGLPHQQAQTLVDHVCNPRNQPPR